MAEKTYLEVFREHYPNVVLKEFYGNYCPAGFFKYGMDMHHPDCTAECDKCWLCTADSEWRENGEYDVPEEWKADVEQEQPTEQQDKPSEPPAADFPTCSCPLWRSEAFKYIGDRKKSISFSCDAYHSEDVTEDNTIDDIEHRCNNYINCEYFLVHELEPVLKAESIKVNVNTPLDRLKQLYETHCQQTVPVPSGAGAPAKNAIDYAALPTELCDYLRNKEEQLKNEYMNFTANCGRIFAEAQEKLAKHGFGENNGMFDKWITAMGFNKQTIYNMISVFKFRSSKIFTNEQAQLFDSLSKSLQYEVAKPSAPPELVEQVMNGDITTHKEYIKLKNELERTKDDLRNVEMNFDEREKLRYKLGEENVQLKIKADELEKQLSEVKWSLDISEDDVRKAEERAEYAENKATEISVKNCELERRLKEIESRPVDVATPDDEEIERLAAERSRELLRAKDMECDRRLREMQSEGRDKDKEISELKERLMTIGEDSEQIENFFEDMYNDAYRALKRCFEFVSESNFTPQTVNKLRLRLNSFSGVVSDFIEEMQQ